MQLHPSPLPSPHMHTTPSPLTIPIKSSLLPLPLGPLPCCVVCSPGGVTPSAFQPPAWSPPCLVASASSRPQSRCRLQSHDHMLSARCLQLVCLDCLSCPHLPHLMTHAAAACLPPGAVSSLHRHSLNRYDSHTPSSLSPPAAFLPLPPTTGPLGCPHA